MKFFLNRLTALTLLGAILSTILIAGCGKKEDSATAGKGSSEAAPATSPVGKGPGDPNRKPQ